MIGKRGERAHIIRHPDQWPLQSTDYAESLNIEVFLDSVRLLSSVSLPSASQITSFFLSIFHSSLQDTEPCCTKRQAPGEQGLSVFGQPSATEKKSSGCLIPLKQTGLFSAGLEEESLSLP